MDCCLEVTSFLNLTFIFNGGCSLSNGTIKLEHTSDDKEFRLVKVKFNMLP